MSSFFERTFAGIAHKPETISAILSTSSPIMNCSAVPVTLSTDKTCDLLCKEQPKNERKLLQLFSTFSDTMQFTEKLRIRNDEDKEFVKGILENLIHNKRYFARTIRLLELPSADALIEACRSDDSATTATPQQLVLSNLRSLSIEGFSDKNEQLQNEQLKTICSLCPFLETLYIPHQQQLTDEGVKFLSNLRHLKMLDIGCCDEITDGGVEHLAKLSSLQSLDLYSCDKISDTGLQHLAKLSSLETLVLEYCDRITDTGIAHLVELSSLRSLDVYRCDKITDDSLEYLAKVSCLESLNLSKCNKITDSGLQHLAKVSSLRSLNLGGCGNITDSGLQHLANLSSLQSLNLYWCDKITDSGLEHIAVLSSLQTLDLEECDKITDSGLEHLRTKLPSTHILA